MGDRVVVGDQQVMDARVLRFLLEEEGFDVVTTNQARAVLDEVIGRETVLVILEVDLPDLSGFDLLKELRARRYHGPCMFVTSRGEVGDKVLGFELSADDYIVKPYEPAELVARVHSVIRRFKQVDRFALGTLVRDGDAELSIGELTYRSDTVGPALLTPTEMRLLEVLMRNARITISRETLVERVWGFDFLGDSNRVDVYIRRVRRKIEPDPERPRYLHTVRGLGYVFKTHAASLPEFDDHLLCEVTG